MRGFCHTNVFVAALAWRVADLAAPQSLDEKGPVAAGFRPLRRGLTIVRPEE